MKKICLIVLLLFANLILAQSGRYTNNGLLYSDKAICTLQPIARSLNDTFKNQKPKQFNSRLQSRLSHYIKLQGKAALSVKQDIEAGLAYTEIKTKHPELFIIDSLLAVRDFFETYDGEQVMRFNLLAEGRAHNLNIDFKGAEYQKYKSITEGWCYNYSPPKGEYGEYIEACYFEDKLESKPLHQKYSALIQYADYLIGTTPVLFDDAVSSYDFVVHEANEKMTAFLDYANYKLEMPVYAKDADFSAYCNKMYLWQVSKWAKADELYKKDNQFKALLTEAYNTTVKGTTNNDFEDYIARYYSNDIALDFKRSRRVVGNCGRSTNTLLHKTDIARLAAETGKWEIFLRAHLDMMNSRPDKFSDTPDDHSSIKELEMIGIDAYNLLLGTCLRVSNPSVSHYNGNINNTGWPLAEMHNSALIDDKLLQMIADDGLDNYNRIIMCYVFLAYNSNLGSVEQKINYVRFKKAVALLPSHLSAGFINENYEDFYFRD